MKAITRKNTNMIYAFVACLLFSPSTSVADAIDIGEKGHLAKLFSYPNNCDTICYLPQSLDQTISIWLRKSIERDGYKSNTLNVFEQNGRILVDLDTDAKQQYASVLPRFLEAGDKALKGAMSVHKDGKWRYNWRFVLPHGLPLVNNKSVQLLHFPPDYVLEDIQDYLKAKTTERWADLLKRNGANPAELDKFQAIVDIAPIAAPAGDGRTLDERNIYSYFTPFIDDLVDLWTTPNTSQRNKPLVVFGAPASKYVEERYKVKLGIAKYAPLTLAGNRELDAIGANHPSRFYNAINSLLDKDPGNIEEAVKLGMSIASDDLVAACWQVRMTMPNAKSGQDELNSCEARWRGKTKEICQVVIEQRFASDDEAKKLCMGTKVNKFRTLTHLQKRALQTSDMPFTPIQ